MRKLPLFLIVIGLLLIYSCKKSNSGGKGSDPSSSYLSSVVNFGAQQRTVDSFYYDPQHRLDTITQIIYDTTSGTPQYNSWTVVFLYQGDATRPSFYNYYDITLGGFGDYHLLSFDASDRITKDTSLSGSAFVTYYSYPNNNIAGTTLFEGTTETNLTDTLYIQNNNLIREVVYVPVIPGQPDQLLGTDNYTFSPTANPAYHQPIANSIGPLLFTLQFINHGSILDFNSKNAYSTDLITNPGSPNLSHQYTLTTDSKGRLAKSALAGGTTTIEYSYYQ
jgi:hypothetical protein